MYAIKKGEKFPIQITIKNSDEDKPIDLTGSIIKLQLKDELKDDFCVVEKIISETTDAYTEGRILDPKLGEFIIRLNDEDYDKLVTERVYYLVLYWIIPDQDFVKVISSNVGDTFKFKVCYP